MIFTAIYLGIVLFSSYVIQYPLLWSLIAFDLISGAISYFKDK